MDTQRSADALIDGERLEILQEGALALAQATIQKAIDDAGLSRAELAKRMDRPRSFISKIMRGDHNLTIKTYALVLAACGFEAEFGKCECKTSWEETKPVPSHFKRNYERKMER
jgi:transcriptional regulator with XRE-family HTH domain